MAKKYHDSATGTLGKTHNSKFSTETIIKNMPEPYQPLTGGMFDDSSEGIDQQIKLDQSKIRSGFKPKKI
jgi:hypothetical protein